MTIAAFQALPFTPILATIDVRLVKHPQIPLTLPKDRSNKAFKAPAGVAEHALRTLPSFTQSTLHGQY